MSRPPLEVADLIRTAGTAFIERNRQWIRWTHIKVLVAIARCRTAALGGHIDECTRGGHRATISYNSCRNRHCPKCQTGARQRWIQARRRELLPSPYGHVGFSAWPVSFFREPGSARATQDLRFLAETTVPKGLGRLLQTALRRPRICAPVSRSLYPSRGHFQSSTGLVGRRPSHLSLARLGSPQ